MISVGNLRIRNAVLCEDVRQEKSNKFILIGVFPGDILVEDVPASVPLDVYIDAIALEPIGSIFLKLSGPGEGSAIIGINYHASLEEGSTETVAALVTPRMEVAVQQ